MLLMLLILLLQAIWFLEVKILSEGFLLFRLAIWLDFGKVMLLNSDNLLLYSLGALWCSKRRSWLVFRGESVFGKGGILAVFVGVGAVVLEFNLRGLAFWEFAPNSWMVYILPSWGTCFLGKEALNSKVDFLLQRHLWLFDSLRAGDFFPTKTTLDALLETHQLQILLVLFDEGGQLDLSLLFAGLLKLLD